MNHFTAMIHRAVQADVDHYIRTGLRPRNFASRRVEREICYADHLKAIVDQVDESRSASAGDVS